MLNFVKYEKGKKLKRPQPDKYSLKKKNNNANYKRISDEKKRLREKL